LAIALVILTCGCLIGLIGFGPRSTFGFFLAPMEAANGWGRDQFSLALAIEMLLWGAGQPFSGALVRTASARRSCSQPGRFFTSSASYGWRSRSARSSSTCRRAC
jgi:hypothetical protein